MDDEQRIEQIESSVGIGWGIADLPIRVNYKPGQPDVTLPVQILTANLSEAYRLIAELTARVEVLEARLTPDGPQ